MPPSAYLDFSQDQQGRLVHVRTAVAATLYMYKDIELGSQRNEDLIVCSVLLSVISFCIVFTLQPYLK